MAVSDKPAGPFAFYGHVHYPPQILGGKTVQEGMVFDPAVLTDDDGRVYLYYGFAPACEKEMIMPRFTEEEIAAMPEDEQQAIRGMLSTKFGENSMVVELEPDMLTAKELPGTLTALALDARGGELGRTTLRSAGQALHVGLHPETEAARPGQIVYVQVAVEDENGVTECNADRSVSIRVENGTLLGFGSANPRTEERYDSGSFTTYYGRALAAVRAGDAGELILRTEDTHITIPICEA